jgi:hypothetical protein
MTSVVPVPSPAISERKFQHERSSQTHWRPLADIQSSVIRYLEAAGQQSTPPKRPLEMITARELAAYVFVAAFLALLLSCGVTDGPVQVWRAMKESRPSVNRVIDLGKPSKSSWSSQVLSRETQVPLGLPDFSKYQPLSILSSREFPIGWSPNASPVILAELTADYADIPHHRVIMVGDVHGMIDSFKSVIGPLQANRF